MKMSDSRNIRDTCIQLKWNHKTAIEIFFQSSVNFEDLQQELKCKFVLYFKIPWIFLALTFCFTSLLLCKVANRLLRY